jgi:hypothetical protein
MSPRQAIIREVSALAGLGLALAGGIIGLATLIVHLAWALPLADLVTRPGMTAALVLALPGLVIRHVGRERGGLHRRAAQSRSLAPTAAGRLVGRI